MTAAARRLLREPLPEHVRVQEPQEAAPEPRAERGARLLLERDARVVHRDAPNRRAHQLVLIRARGEQTLEHHRTSGAKPGEGRGRRWRRRGGGSRARARVFVRADQGVPDAAARRRERERAAALYAGALLFFVGALFAGAPAAAALRGGGDDAPDVARAEERHLRRLGRHHPELQNLRRVPRRGGGNDPDPGPGPGFLFASSFASADEGILLTPSRRSDSARRSE